MVKVELRSNVRFVDNFPLDGAVADFFMRDDVRGFCRLLELREAEGLGRTGRPITGFAELTRDFPVIF